MRQTVALKERMVIVMNQEIGDRLRMLAEVFHLKKFCHKVGIAQFVYRRCNKDKLQSSDLFFTENKARIDRNSKMFSDESSREIYKKAIRYRRRGYLRDLPPLCKERQYFNSLTPISQTEILVDGGGIQEIPF